MATQRICENDKHEIKSYPVGEDKRSSCALRFWRLDNLLGWLRLGFWGGCITWVGISYLKNGGLVAIGWGRRVVVVGKGWVVVVVGVFGC
ncbi:unnamed protein product [Prunus armeniaca]|uniref:Transmembrane protein n=1 Tax=Prunus armeniaca TaxID=36596 RepID=A0A6J5WWA8_PRUAR|nr:unnamed protein product [Prunus armeniaca]